MNNLIGEPQCAPGEEEGGASQRPRRKFGILFRPWNFIRQARPYSESQLFPALCPMFAVPTFMRYAYQRPVDQNSIFANYSATFSHLPLFRMGRIVSQNIMNYFAPYPSTCCVSLSLSLFLSLSLLPRLSRSRQVYT